MPSALVEHAVDGLGLLDADGADQHRLAALVGLLDLLDDGLELAALGLVDEVVLVLAHHGRLVGMTHDVEVVDLVELLGFGVGRAGHAGQLLVDAEVVLEGDGGEGAGSRLDLDALLGLDGLVQPVDQRRPASCGRKLVDDDDLAVLDDVVDVLLVETCAPQRLVDVVQQLVVLGRVEVLAA
jgi:hypothetical protein